MTDTQMKVCGICKVEKPANLANFPAHALTLNMFGPYCRPCQNGYSRDWKRQNSARLAAERRARYAADNGAQHKLREEARMKRQPLLTSARRLMQGVRERSKKRGTPLWPQLRSKKFIADWLRRQPNCPCCGVKFALGNIDKNGRYLPNSPSFDQYERGKGYVEGNVELICTRCNMIKREFTQSELRMVADWMDRRGNETDKFGVPA